MQAPCHINCGRTAAATNQSDLEPGGFAAVFSYATILQVKLRRKKNLQKRKLDKRAGGE